jgi:hypothetical protein
MYPILEAAALGLASGPACLASCGPVLLPSLTVPQSGVRGTAGLLGFFLSGRLAGYLAFSVMAWALGMAVPQAPRFRELFFGSINLGLSALLMGYAVRFRPVCAAGCGRSRPFLVGLGLLTGVNICPPFLAAGARAAELRSLPSAVIFFVVFFAATAVWTAPLVASGWLRRFAAPAQVARIMLYVLAAFYAYRGVLLLLPRVLYGR